MEESRKDLILKLMRKTEEEDKDVIVVGDTNIERARIKIIQESMTQKE